MRNFIVVCVIAIVVACGVAYAVGFVDVSGEHQSGKYVVTTTINTGMLEHHRSAAEPAANPDGEPAGENTLDIRGKVTAVRPDKQEIVVSENVKSWVFQLAKDGRVSINDRNATLKELQPGDDAVVAYEREGQKMIATSIRCTRK